MRASLLLVLILVPGEVLNYAWLVMPDRREVQVRSDNVGFLRSDPIATR
jgi:hypothetical protein